MQKNVASQKWTVFAFDITDNLAKTGDASQITANIKSEDFASDLEAIDFGIKIEKESILVYSELRNYILSCVILAISSSTGVSLGNCR